VVGVLIDNDLVTVPEPIIHEVIIVGSHAEIKSTKRKPLRATARQPVYMARPNATAKVAVFPRMIEVIMDVVPARVVSNPRIVAVNVRSIRVPALITVITSLGCIVYLLRWVRRLRMYRCVRGGGSVGGNVLLAHALWATLLGVTFMLLSIQGTCRQ